MGAQLLSDLLLSLCSNVFGVGSDSGVAIDHPGGLHAAASKHLKSITAIRSYQPGKVQYSMGDLSDCFQQDISGKLRHSTGDLSDMSDCFQQDALSNGLATCQ